MTRSEARAAVKRLTQLIHDTVAARVEAAAIAYPVGSEASGVEVILGVPRPKAGKVTKITEHAIIIDSPGGGRRIIAFDNLA